MSCTLRPFPTFLATALATIVGHSAAGHFPFIVPDAGGATALLIMSESLEPDAAIGIGLLADAKLLLRDGRGAEWPLESPLRGGERASLRLALSGEGTRVVTGIIDLGVMERGAVPHVLVYHPKSIVGDALDLKTDLPSDVPIEIVPLRTPEGVVLRLEFDGLPKAGAPVTVVRAGSPDVELTTDASGCTPPVAAGRVGAWARRWVDAAGERQGRTFSQMRHYATLVADLPGEAAPSAADVARTDDAVPVGRLPRAVASFGATVHDGWLYVYGGHSGTRHDYSTATVSARLSRTRLDELAAGSGIWEELPGGPPVQGMNLVSYRDAVIRVGGMEPRNAAGAPADNHSIADVAAFRPADGRWTNLPPLPEPRSSHDLAIVGDTLVVVGGWSMAGAGQPIAWLDDVLLLDMAAALDGTSSGEWERVAQPFRRRALIAGVLGTSVYAIGGFDESDEAHPDVDILDCATRTWTKGPSLPGPSRNCFAPAACVCDGRLYVSVASGELLRLSQDRSAWEPVATATPRIVHRLIAHGNEVLIVGGAREAVMSDLIESVSLDGTRRRAQAANVVTLPAAELGSESLEDVMEAIDESFEALSHLQAAGWAGAIEDSESDASSLAAALKGHLQAVPGDGPRLPEGFRTIQRASVERATELERLARAKPLDPSAMSSQLALLRASCTECHRAYRH